MITSYWFCGCFSWYSSWDELLQASSTHPLCTHDARPIVLSANRSIDCRALLNATTDTAQTAAAHHMISTSTLLKSPAASRLSPALQIAESAATGLRPPLRPHTIAHTSATRLLLPLYLTLCPHNIVRAPTRPGLAAVLVAWTAVQVRGCGALTTFACCLEARYLQLRALVLVWGSCVCVGGGDAFVFWQDCVVNCLCGL